MKSVRKSRASLKQKSWLISQLPGLSDDECRLLAAQGIHTTADLLNRGASLAQRSALATLLQVHAHHVQKWVALADLASVPSVGIEFCGLLLHAGVGSVAQLAQTPLSKIHQLILKLYVSMMQRQDLCPSVAVMAQWTAEAQQLTAQRQARMQASR